MKSLNLILSTFFCMSVLGCSSNSGSSSGGNNNVEPLDVSLSVDQQQIVIQDKVISVKKVELSRGLSKDTYFEINTGKKYLKFKIEGRDNKLVSKLTSVEEKYFAMVYDESIEEFEIDVDRIRDGIAVVNSLILRRCARASSQLGLMDLVLSKRNIVYLAIQDKHGHHYGVAIKWDLAKREVLGVEEVNSANGFLLISESNETFPVMEAAVNLRDRSKNLLLDNALILPDEFNYQCQTSTLLQIPLRDRSNFARSMFVPTVDKDGDNRASDLVLESIHGINESFSSGDDAEVFTRPFTYISKELENEIRNSPLFKEIKKLDGQ